MQSCVFADLRTGTVLGSVPLSQVSFGHQLNGAGSFSGTLNLAAPRVQKSLAFLGGGSGGVLQPGRTAIYVDRDGVLEWGGIYLTDKYDSTTRQATIGGQEFWWYLSNRCITWAADYANHDQLVVARDLVSQVQAVTGGDIGVTSDPNVLSGQNVSVRWDPNQLVTISQAFQTLAQQSGAAGFDFMVDVAYDANGKPTKTLSLGYPRRGRIAGATGLVFDAGSPRWSLGYQWQRDATAQATVMYGIGAGVGPAVAGGGSSPLRSTQAAPQLVDAGYPILEGKLQRSDVTSQTLLDRLTLTELVAAAYPVVIPVTTHRLDMPTPAYGSWLVGDDARLIIPADEFFPSGQDAYWRIVADKVTLSDEGVSTVQLSWNAPPYF